MKQRFSRTFNRGAGRSPTVAIVAVLICIAVVIVVSMVWGRISKNEFVTTEPPPARPSPLAGGEFVSWAEQGMSWVLPQGWTRKSLTKTEFEYTAGDEASFKVSVEPMAAGLPPEMTLQGYYQGAQVRQKNGQLDEVKLVALDSLRGVQIREAATEPQRPRSLQWTSMRNFGGNEQRINMSLSVKSAIFEKHREEFYAILNSTRIGH
jgi:hypothetical protein